MSRITHFKQQPKNIQYWDYYILCRLNVCAAIALQRMEYWDGTKEEGNVHAEALNDALAASGKGATQDTSRWVYKAQDELQWEMMGICGERGVAALLDFLIDDLGYLQKRSNPDITFDRKRQYLFCDELVQQHLAYLNYLVGFFKRIGCRLNPVFYAIELLTRHVTIEELSVDHIMAQLAQIHMQSAYDEQCLEEKRKNYKPTHPKFVRAVLQKDKKTLSQLDSNLHSPFRNFAEWKAQNCGMHSDNLRNGIRENAAAIAVTTNSNYNTVTTNKDTYSSRGNDTEHSSHPAIADVTPEASSLLSENEELKQRIKHLETMLQTTTSSGTGIQEKYPEPSAQAAEEYSYSQVIQSTIENQDEEEAQPPLLDAPLSEPDMTGKWVAWKPVRYAEWKNGKHYTENQFNKQLEAARKIKRENTDITLGQYKQVHNHWFDWWTENRCEPLHVSDVAGKQKNGMPRVQSAVDRIEMQKNKPATGNQNVTAFKQRSTTQSAAQKITTEQAVQQGFQTLTMEQKKRLLLDFPDPEERRAHIQEMRQQQQQAVSAK